MHLLLSAESMISLSTACLVVLNQCVIYEVEIHGRWSKGLDAEMKVAMKPKVYLL